MTRVRRGHAIFQEQWPSLRAVCGVRTGEDNVVILHDDPPGWHRHITCPKCLEDPEVKAAIVEHALALAPGRHA